jgi:hypothetical protein
MEGKERTFTELIGGRREPLYKATILATTTSLCYKLEAAFCMPFCSPSVVWAGASKADFH